MERQILVKKAWNYIADKDEDANIVIDGKIDNAAELIADFVESLIDNGALAETNNGASALPIPDVINCKIMCEKIPTVRIEFKHLPDFILSEEDYKQMGKWKGFLRENSINPRDVKKVHHILM